MNEPAEDDQPLSPPSAEVHSVASREPLRSRLAADVEAFLARGGSIQEVPRDYRADPPKRPDTSYGRGSI
ncbi:MAG TPA: hypothetical protein VF210_16445 [Pseudomonadales bacterium]